MYKSICRDVTNKSFSCGGTGGRRPSSDLVTKEVSLYWFLLSVTRAGNIENSFMLDGMYRD